MMGLNLKRQTQLAYPLVTHLGPLALSFHQEVRLVPAPALALLLDSGVLDTALDAVRACIHLRRYDLDWRDVEIFPGWT